MKWKETSEQCQKFMNLFVSICAMKPTGVTQDQILSMSIVNHLGKLSSLSSADKDYPHEKFVEHLTYKLLQTIPNFSDDVGDY